MGVGLGQYAGEEITTDLPVDFATEHRYRYGRFTRVAFAFARNSSCQGADISIDLDVAPISISPIS